MHLGKKGCRSACGPNPIYVFELCRLRRVRRLVRVMDVHHVLFQRLVGKRPETASVPEAWHGRVRRGRKPLSSKHGPIVISWRIGSRGVRKHDVLVVSTVNVVGRRQPEVCAGKPPSALPFVKAPAGVLPLANQVCSDRQCLRAPSEVDPGQQKGTRKDCDPKLDRFVGVVVGLFVPLLYNPAAG